MPRLRSPRPLLSLCVSAVAKRIISQSERLCREFPGGAMPANLEVARREYVSSLPGTVRALLSEEVGQLLSVVWITLEKSAMLSNFAAAMLLGPDVQGLCVQLCCPGGCGHQEALLALVAQEGAGLKSLELVLPACRALEPTLLHRALIRPVSMKHLCLPRICRDAYLQIISSTCPNLSLLDVSESKCVTDNGLRFLFLREEAPLMEDVTSPRDTHLCLDTSCGNVECKLVRLLINLFSWMQCSGEGNGVAASLRHILQCWKRETELCGSLCVLDIGETSVTPRGAVFALMRAPLLRSLGTYLHLGSALEVFDACWREVYPSNLVDLPTFDLLSMFSRHITEPQCSLIGKYLPRLRLLEIYDPQLDPPALELLPPTLNFLNIGKLTSKRLRAVEIYSLGNTPLGRNLQSLSLSWPPEQGTEINLHDLFQSCPTLTTFRGVGMHVHWAQGMNSYLSMPHLRFLILSQVVDKEVVVEILRRCPNLKVAHFDRCPDLTDGDIVKAAYASSEHLKCFHVSEAPCLTAQAFLVMQTAYENLSSIGDLTQWDISYEEFLKIRTNIKENNWDLKLTDWPHWFSSVCNTSDLNFFNVTN